MFNKYQNGKIYKVYNINDEKEFSIGSTYNALEQRFREHCNTARNGGPCLMYVRMRRRGIQNFRIELIEEYPCNSQRELYRREQYWFDILKPTMNENRASAKTGYHPSQMRYEKQSMTHQKIEDITREYFRKIENQQSQYKFHLKTEIYIEATSEHLVNINRKWLAMRKISDFFHKMYNSIKKCFCRRIQRTKN